MAKYRLSKYKHKAWQLERWREDREIWEPFRYPGNVLGAAASLLDLMLRAQEYRIIENCDDMTAALEQFTAAHETAVSRIEAALKNHENPCIEIIEMPPIQSSDML